MGYPVASKFYGGVQNLVLVERAAESDDNVLSCYAVGQVTAKLDLDHARDLPPCFSGGPQSCSVCAHYGCANTADASVHVAVAIARDGESVGKCIALFYEDLVSNAPARRVKIDAMGARKGFDVCVFRQVFGRLVLDVVVEGEHWLGRVVDRCSADGLESKDS